MTAILKLPYKVSFANSDEVRIDYKYINAEKIVDFEEYNRDGSLPKICIRYGGGKDAMTHLNSCITMEELLSMLVKAGAPVVECSIQAELGQFIQENFE